MTAPAAGLEPVIPLAEQIGAAVRSSETLHALKAQRDAADDAEQRAADAARAAEKAVVAAERKHGPESVEAHVARARSRLARAQARRAGADAELALRAAHVERHRIITEVYAAEVARLEAVAADTGADAR